jgi:hypothetical protein
VRTSGASQLPVSERAEAGAAQERQEQPSSHVEQDRGVHLR